MKILKSLGYYSLFLLYYLIAFAMILFTFEPPSGERNIDGFGLFIALIGIASPFLVINWLINKFYRGNKKKHSTGVASTIICFMVLHAIGVANTTGGFNSSYLPFYAFNLCLIISLFIYRPKLSYNEVV
jgi:hypothetical protein